MFAELRYHLAYEQRARAIRGREIVTTIRDSQRDDDALFYLGAWLSEMLCGWLE